MGAFFGFVFFTIIAVAIFLMVVAIVKTIYNSIKELFISLAIWMGDEELKKKRKNKRHEDFLKYDDYQG
jgi:hypothetical protein